MIQVTYSMPSPDKDYDRLYACLHVHSYTCSCIPQNNIILNITIFTPGQADNGYPGQVKLKNLNPNDYRQVQLYMDESTQKWRDVCVKKDSADKIADSICRQLGFTNAKNTPSIYTR